MRYNENKDSEPSTSYSEQVQRGTLSAPEPFSVSPDVSARVHVPGNNPVMYLSCRVIWDDIR